MSISEVAVRYLRISIEDRFRKETNRISINVSATTKLKLSHSFTGQAIPSSGSSRSSFANHLYEANAVGSRSKRRSAQLLRLSAKPAVATVQSSAFSLLLLIVGSCGT